MDHRLGGRVKACGCDSLSSSSSTNFIATQVWNKTSGPLCVTYYTNVNIVYCFLVMWRS